jgi:hypothetical protein
MKIFGRIKKEDKFIYDEPKDLENINNVIHLHYSDYPKTDI